MNCKIEQPAVYKVKLRYYSFYLMGDPYGYTRFTVVIMAKDGIWANELGSIFSNNNYLMC